jgi:hypothetical protein
MVRNQRVLMCLGPEFNEAALFDPKGNFSVAGGYASSLGTLYPEGMLLRDDKKHKKHEGHPNQLSRLMHLNLMWIC